MKRITVSKTVRTIVSIIEFIVATIVLGGLILGGFMLFPMVAKNKFLILQIIIIFIGVISLIPLMIISVSVLHMRQFLTMESIIFRIDRQPLTHISDATLGVPVCIRGRIVPKEIPKEVPLSVTYQTVG